MRGCRRDPISIIRSVQLPVPGDSAGEARDTLENLASRGFSHFVLSYRAPYRHDLVPWSVDEIIAPVRERLDLPFNGG